MDTGKVVLGMLAGLAAGAALGILFAPAKGNETRRKIAQKGSDSIDDLKAKLDEMMDAMVEKFEEVKEETAEFFEKGKSKADDLKKGIKAEMS